jgi:hypothetical protein
MKLEIKNAPPVSSTPTVEQIVGYLNLLINNNGWFVRIHDGEFGIKSCSNNDYTKLICYISLLLANQYKYKFGGPNGGFTRFGGSLDDLAVTFTSLTPENLTMLWNELSKIQKLSDIVLTV